MSGIRTKGRDVDEFTTRHDEKPNKPFLHVWFYCNRKGGKEINKEKGHLNISALWMRKIRFGSLKNFSALDGIPELLEFLWKLVWDQPTEPQSVTTSTLKLRLTQELVVLYNYKAPWLTTFSVFSVVLVAFRYSKDLKRNISYISKYTVQYISLLICCFPLRKRVLCIRVTRFCFFGPTGPFLFLRIRSEQQTNVSIWTRISKRTNGCESTCPIYTSAMAYVSAYRLYHLSFAFTEALKSQKQSTIRQLWTCLMS